MNNQGSYQGGQGMDYTVDMVFCIDATGSMENLTGSQKRIINMVKENALRFYDDMLHKMEAKHKPMAKGAWEKSHYIKVEAVN